MKLIINSILMFIVTYLIVIALFCIPILFIGKYTNTVFGVISGLSFGSASIVFGLFYNKGSKCFHY